VPRTSILALVGVALAVAGCGSSSKTGSSSTTAAAASATTTTASTSSSGPFLAKFTSVSKVASTVPANGDVNPYGIVLVPTSVGKLQAGQLLISNFNTKEGGQGTGTTIVQVSRSGKVSLFASIDAKSLPGSCPGGVGLTTALDILPGGYVVVGSLPTTDGKSATAKYGCLIVLDSEGRAVETIAGKNIQGPWDSTSVSKGSKTTLFISNALNGGAAKAIKTIDNSTVLRIELESGEGQTPKVLSETVIADGIPWVDSAEALVLGPTGLALASNGTLYVASTDGSKILAISEAMTRTTAAAKGGTVLTEGGHLKEPLGMVIAPNGNIITSNGGDGNMVETTPAGQQVAVQTADKKTGAGTLFGLVIAPEGKGIYFVDDGENTLNLLSEGQAGASTESSTTASAAAPTSTSKPSAAVSAPAVKAISVSVRTLPNVGAVLVNAEGHTLYTFAPDNHSKVTCVSSCASVWPPLKLASGETAAGSPPLKASLLSSDPDPEGGSVITYAGWPLYTYEADSAAGQDNGQTIEANGGHWYVIAPSGKVITTG
jgi:predicted lipoprotein with Yx(FWY)xxD motif/sugar lactone lactonase YvrE